MTLKLINDEHTKSKHRKKCLNSFKTIANHIVWNSNKTINFDFRKQIQESSSDNTNDLDWLLYLNVIHVFFIQTS